VSRVIDEHRGYLADRHRVQAFRDALLQIVAPGDVVVDLGCGSGILGLLACRAGASRVYAIDEGSILGLAREVAAAGPYAERIVHIRGFSTAVSLPEPADVVVTDQIGGFGFEAGAFEYLPDARRRFLRAGGRSIPDRIALCAAPCEHDEARGWVEFWTEPVLDFDFSAVLPMAASTSYAVTLERSHLLAQGQVLADVPVAEWSGEALNGRVSWSIERAGTLHGLGGWFSATLAPGVELTNAPGSPARIRRHNVLLPVDPVAVEPGDRVEAVVTILPNKMVADWTVVVTDAQGQRRLRSRHSTLGGLLLSAEDLARTNPSARPVLSRAGEVRRLVLDLCDGTHTVQEIEREAAARFADLFPADEDAARLVAELVIPLTR
jgi:protein arginine N-methyltransferase 1